jgi:AmmeMemoRadiSam system protein B/AmmeMemoRadiSam system protein A
MDARRPNACPPLVLSLVLACLVAPVAAAGSAETSPAESPKEKVHACAGAGQWFPADADRLKQMVDGFLGEPAAEIPRRPVALIVPHAGYEYSGALAGKGYATLKGRSYKRVILLGLSHQAAVRGASVLRADAYETPLGRIPVDAEARDALLKCPVVREQTAAHAGEWSVENQLPMLQRALKDFAIVEVIVGVMTPAERTTLAEALRKLADAETLLVVGTDFTHYGPRFGYVPFKDLVAKRLADLNDKAVAKILDLDANGWDRFIAETGDTVCGQAAVGLLLETLKAWGDVKGQRVAFDTSGRITGDWENSVTYASIVLWRTGEAAYLQGPEKQTLLRLARDVLKEFLNTGKASLDESKYDLTGVLKRPGAAFVTLKNHGRLRGCIGTFLPRAPLYQTVAEMARAATQDFRFRGNPVTPAELGDIDIEISVLTPLQKVGDPLAEIELGRHGIYIEGEGRSGCFLPQVATETGWSKEEFLSQCAAGKAGLAPDAWKKPGVTVYRFEAHVFGEKLVLRSEVAPLLRRVAEEAKP